MPGGDRTGPMGFGPRTGRAAGFCSGFRAPGYANHVRGGRGPVGRGPLYWGPPGPGPGIPGPGFGRRGRGFGRRGRGFGLGRSPLMAYPAPVHPVYAYPPYMGYYLWW